MNARRWADRLIYEGTGQIQRVVMARELLQG
jgi:alkylation response protein AidB-like acyl-CoA dehydrogenase